MPRLPGGGGYPVCGLYDISFAKFGQSSNVVKLANGFGEQLEVYNGVDLSLNARLPRGFVISGGTSTGRVMNDNCFVIDSPQRLLNCKTVPPFQTQVKMIVVYPLPWWGLQTAATIQSIPGPEVTASYSASFARDSVRRSAATSRRAGPPPRSATAPRPCRSWPRARCSATG